MNDEEGYHKFKRKALKIIRKIQACPESQYFVSPYDLANADFGNYCRQIPNFMTLADVYDKIERDEYAYPEEFKEDVRKIFASAKIVFSDQNESIVNAAEILQERFDIEAAKLPHVASDEEKNSLVQRYIELKIMKYRLAKTDHI